MARETLGRLLIVGGLNGVLTLAYPSALVSLLFVSEFAWGLRLLAVLSVLLAGVGCFTILGLRRYLAADCGFEGASRALAVHAWVTAGSGVAILVGWGVLRLGSSESSLSWALGLGVLGFFLVVAGAIGLLELLIASALARCPGEGYGLLGAIRITFGIVGAANLISILIGITIVAGMVAYAVVSLLLFLLFYAAWRDRSGRLPAGFRYGRAPLAAVVVVAVLSLAVPTTAGIQELRQQLQETESEDFEEEPFGAAPSLLPGSAHRR